MAASCRSSQMNQTGRFLRFDWQARCRRNGLVQGRSNREGAPGVLRWQMAGAPSHMPKLSWTGALNPVVLQISFGARTWRLSRACPVSLEPGQALETVDWRMFLTANRHPLRRNMR